MSNAAELLRRVMDAESHEMLDDVLEEIEIFLAAEKEAEPVADNLLVKMFEALEAGLSIRSNSVFHDLIKKHLSDSKNYHIGWVNKERNLLSWDKLYEDMEPLYTRSLPAIRKPMTDGDLLREWQRHFYNDAWDAFEAGIRWAEKHHKIGGDDA